ncbi:molybdopterin dinucleotide binding domain-containing protein, partial [Thermanaerothrix sp.]|uniref:molybdopterin dinucleotide binding domain-containing protein n=1 Tax=Thermanaerothrix sp. TaxID=2972675 RepID=UPI002ADE0C87
VSGIPLEQLEALAQTFASAERPLALVGGSALTQPNGLVTAQAVLALNALVGNLGQPGGVFLSPADATPAPLEAVRDLIQRMQAGEVDVLFIHGVNPLFELPAALGFEAALTKVPQVINFASFPDETALKSDYLFPDHSPLESFGYQRSLPGSDRPAWSALQPVVVPLYDTRATVDVLLAAAQVSGHALPYQDEVDFIQQKILPLINAGGFYTAPEILTFWSRWLQYGGWWTPEADLSAPSLERLPASFGTLTPPTPPAEGAFYLLTYANHLGDGSGANRPWLQELPDAMTTVTWNSWVEIHPHTADELGLKDDDVVRITTPYGTVEASVYRYPAIRPDTIALPFGQGHTALGRWAEGRGCNPAQVLPATRNAAGDLAFIGTTATLTPTGRRRPLARVESKEGVYGKH